MFPPGVRLFRCQPREIGVYLPVPLSGRLDALVEIAKDAWAPAMRKEVMSALLLAAKPGTRWLASVLSRYQSAIVRDAFVPGWDKSFFLWPPEDRGPRPLRLWDDPDQLRFEDVPAVDESGTLSAASEYRIGMPVPSPLAGRLEILLQIANAQGSRVTRKELVAALILDAPTGGSELAVKLAKYWHATAVEALIPGHDATPIYSLPYTSRRSSRRRS